MKPEQLQVVSASEEIVRVNIELLPLSSSLLAISFQIGTCFEALVFRLRLFASTSKIALRSRHHRGAIYNIRANRLANTLFVANSSNTL